MFPHLRGGGSSQGEAMKIIRTRHDLVNAEVEKLEAEGKTCKVIDMKSHVIIEINEVEKKVDINVKIDNVDKDGSNHITKEEVVKYVKSKGSKKSTEEIIDEIDTNDNNRITKKEVREYFEKEDK